MYYSTKTEAGKGAGRAAAPEKQMKAAVPVLPIAIHVGEHELLGIGVPLEGEAGTMADSTVGSIAAD